MINLISKDVSVSTLIIFWQFILKGLDELSIVSNQILSLEMLVIRLLHLKDMPSYQSILDGLNKDVPNYNKQTGENHLQGSTSLTEKSETNKISKDQIKTTTQTKIKSELSGEKISSESVSENISSFEDLINLSSKKKEIELKYDLERHVNLIKFSVGKIDISFNEELGKNFVRNLSEKLLEWTGKRWVITLTRDAGQKSFIEKKSIERNQILNDEKKREVYKKFKNLFPDAELIEVSKED